MGRGIGVLWPEILRKMDAETLQLKTQFIPGLLCALENLMGAGMGKCRP